MSTKVTRPSQLTSPAHTLGGQPAGSAAHTCTSSMFQPGYVRDPSVGPMPQRMRTCALWSATAEISNVCSCQDASLTAAPASDARQITVQLVPLLPLTSTVALS